MPLNVSSTNRDHQDRLDNDEFYPKQVVNKVNCWSLKTRLDKTELWRRGTTSKSLFYLFIVSIPCAAKRIRATCIKPFQRFSSTMNWTELSLSCLEVDQKEHWFRCLLNRHDRCGLRYCQTIDPWALSTHSLWVFIVVKDPTCKDLSGTVIVMIMMTIMDIGFGKVSSSRGIDKKKLVWVSRRLIFLWMSVCVVLTLLESVRWLINETVEVKEDLHKTKRRIILWLCL